MQRLDQLATSAAQCDACFAWTSALYLDEKTVQWHSPTPPVAALIVLFSLLSNVTKYNRNKVEFQLSGTTLIQQVGASGNGWLIGHNFVYLFGCQVRWLTITTSKFSLRVVGQHNLDLSLNSAMPNHTALNHLNNLTWLHFLLFF